MQKINFQNLPNTTTPVNATNLNAIQTNTENEINNINTILSNILKTYTLYNNSSGSNTSITLSDSKSNYDYLEIYYLTEGHKGSIKVLSDVESFALSVAIPYTSTYIRNARFSVSTNSISCSNFTSYEINDSGLGNYTSNVNNNTFYITKVLGYKF